MKFFQSFGIALRNAWTKSNRKTLNKRMNTDRKPIFTRQAVPPTTRQPTEALSEEQRFSKRFKTALTALAPLFTGVSRQSLPLLQYCRLGDGLLEATDLETCVTISFPELAFPRTCVPYADIRRLLRTLGTKLLIFERAEDSLKANGSFLLPTKQEYVTEWPNNPLRPQYVCVDEPFTFPDRWKRVLPAVPKEETRTQLLGLSVDLRHQRLAASDGHRLHSIQLTGRKGIHQVLLPANALKVLARLAEGDGLRGSFYGHMDKSEDEIEAVAIETGPVTMTVKISEVDTYPDLSELLPSRPTGSTVTFRKVDLLKACKQVIACAGRTVRPHMVWTFRAENVLMEFNEKNCPVFTDSVPCRGHDPGDWLGINALYLDHAISQVSRDTISLVIPRPKEGIVQNPVHLVDRDFRVVIMPVKVSEQVVSEIEHQ